MSKGDMPIGYVVAIVLAIVVIALVTYWIFVEGGIFGGVASETTCQGKLYQYCTFWSLCNYTGEENTRDCRPGKQSFYDSNKECKQFESKLQPSTADGCRTILKQIERPAGQ